jgi:hypothetical protein
MKPDQVEKVIDDIRWHNDGGAVEGTFWNDTFKAKVPVVEYGLPQTKEGAVMTFLDRVDQSSIDVKAQTGGPFKIAANVEKFKPNLESTVREAFFNNPSNTKKQIGALVERNPFIAESQMYQRGMSELGSTDRLARQFEFGTGANAGQVRVAGAPAGRYATNMAELKEQIRLYATK